MDTLKTPFHIGSTLSDSIAAAASAFGAREAIVAGENRLTYKGLWDLTREVGDWLANQVPAGPVLAQLGNVPSSLAFVLGAIGAARAPLLADPAWRARELLTAAGRCGAAFFLDQAPEGRCHFAAAREVSRLGDLRLYDLSGAGVQPQPVDLCPDTAFGRFTSGTTGFSRCLRFSQGAALAAAFSWWRAAGYTPSDSVLCLATLNNGLAFNTSLLSVLLSGARLNFHTGAMLPGPIRATIHRTRPTVLVAFPFVYEMLLAKGEALPPETRLRLAVSSAAPLKEATYDAWLAATSVPVCNYYGIAEVGPVTFNDGREPRSVGAALPDVSIRVVDETGAPRPCGETGGVRVKTASMALGFLDRSGPAFSESLDADGYYVASDLGSLSPAGNLTLRGRKGRVINVSGRKIDPVEIEKTIRGLVGVTDVAVCGVDTPERTLVAAFVEGGNLEYAQIVAHCRAQLAQYKVPQLVRVHERLPRSSTGKVFIQQLLNTMRNGDKQ